MGLNGVQFGEQFKAFEAAENAGKHLKGSARARQYAQAAIDIQNSVQVFNPATGKIETVLKSQVKPLFNVNEFNNSVGLGRARSYQQVQQHAQEYNGLLAVRDVKAKLNQPIDVNQAINNNIISRPGRGPKVTAAESMFQTAPTPTPVRANTGYSFRDFSRKAEGYSEGLKAATEQTAKAPKAPAQRNFVPSGFRDFSQRATARSEMFEQMAKTAPVPAPKVNLNQGVVDNIKVQLSQPTDYQKVINDQILNPKGRGPKVTAAESMFQPAKTGFNWKKFGKWALIGAAVVGGVALIAGLVKNHKAKKEAAAEEALRQADVQNQQQAAIDQLQKDVQAQQAQIEELQQQNQDLQDQIKAIPVVATTENDDATVTETENDEAKVAETENDDTTVAETENGDDNVTGTEDGKDDAKTSDVDKENLPHCADKMYTTKSGDNFWNLAKQNLKDKYGRVPTNTEILDETLRLMELNGYKLAEDGIHSDPMLYVDDELIIN